MPESDRIIRMKTVLTRTGLSRSTIYRKIAEGTFPPQIKISTNGAGWKESDLAPKFYPFLSSFWRLDLASLAG